MHPDAADLGLGAVVHDPLRDLGSRDDHHAVDPARIAVAGFSDGASYALSLGLTNGTLLTPRPGLLARLHGPGRDARQPALLP